MHLKRYRPGRGLRRDDIEERHSADPANQNSPIFLIDFGRENTSPPDFPVTSMNSAARRVLLTALALALTGCTTSKALVGTSEPQARIRVFNQNGPATRFNPGKTCYMPETILGIGDKGIQASAGFWSEISDNKVLGMPIAPDTPKGFHEYAVRAGEPMTVEVVYRMPGMSGAGSYTSVCGPIGGTFTPEVGGDYEAYMQMQGRSCKLVVRQLVTLAGTVETKPIQYHSAYACAK